MATVAVTVIEPRMMTLAEAAAYCGRPQKRFRSECPVVPVAFGDRDMRFDRVDLDRWLDGLKAGAASTARADILARL